MDTAPADSLAASPAAARYSGGAIFFHWIIAILIAFNFAAAWTAEGKPRPQAMQIMTNHKAIGLTILLLSLAQLAWRLMHRPPPLPADLKPWEKGLARTVHTLFYVLIIGLPIGGWLAHSYFSGGKPISFFGLFNYPGLPVAQSQDMGETIGGLHGTFAWVLLGLAALHVVGALKHHFIERDGELWRMIPRPR